MLCVTKHGYTARTTLKLSVIYSQYEKTTYLRNIYFIEKIIFIICKVTSAKLLGQEYISVYSFKVCFAGDGQKWFKQNDVFQPGCVVWPQHNLVAVRPTVTVCHRTYQHVHRLCSSSSWPDIYNLIKQSVAKLGTRYNNIKI